MKEVDAFLVKTHNLSSAADASIRKFFLLYEGPYCVHKVINSNCYEISDADSIIVSRQNIVNLKPYATEQII